MFHLRKTGLVALAFVLASTTAHAGTSDYTHGYFFFFCWMDGSQVVPPSDLGRMGGGCITLYDRMLYYTISLESALPGLTEAHIHGPAMGGENAPIVFTLAPSMNSVFEGVLGPLTDTQFHEFTSAYWYVDIHTTDYPLGALRGQMKQILTAINPCTLGVEEHTWGAVKSLYR